MKNLKKLTIILIGSIFINITCNDDNSNNETSAGYTFSNGSLDDLDVSLDHDPENPRGDSPLMIAVGQNDFNHVKDLLETDSTVNIDFQNLDGKSALHYAVQLDNANIAKLLLSRGNPDIADHEGNTPLHIAAQYNAFATARELMKHGANPLVQNNNFENPLECALNNEMRTILSRRIQ